MRPVGPRRRPHPMKARRRLTDGEEIPGGEAVDPRSCEVDDLVLDLLPPPPGRLEFEDPQAEVGGQGDVLRLADIETLALQRIEGQLAAGTDRRQPLLLALGVDVSPEDV